jgi:predicted nucleic acid-binding protein
MQKTAGLIIADTGPLISLAVIDKLSLLESIYGNIGIPKAVWRELNKYSSVLSLASLSNYDKNIITLNAVPPDLGLDDGETEAIALFEETHASRLLVDDKAARRVAEQRQIPCIGALGVLAIAKDLGLIPAMRPLFSKLIEESRYYSIPVLNMILNANGEESLA